MFCNLMNGVIKLTKQREINLCAVFIATIIERKLYMDAKQSTHHVNE